MSVFSCSNFNTWATQKQWHLQKYSASLKRASIAFGLPLKRQTFGKWNGRKPGPTYISHAFYDFCYTEHLFHKPLDNPFWLLYNALCVWEKSLAHNIKVIFGAVTPGMVSNRASGAVNSVVDLPSLKSCQAPYETRQYIPYWLTHTQMSVSFGMYHCQATYDAFCLWLDHFSGLIERMMIDDIVLIC